MYMKKNCSPNYLANVNGTIFVHDPVGDHAFGKMAFVEKKVLYRTNQAGIIPWHDLPILTDGFPIAGDSIPSQMKDTFVPVEEEPLPIVRVFSRQLWIKKENMYIHIKEKYYIYNLECTDMTKLLT